MTAIVAVGVDGSPASHAALRFAIREARLRGAIVRAVLAWDPELGGYGGSGWDPAVDPGVLEHRARATLDAAVDSAETDAAETDAAETEPNVEIELVVAVGRPAQVLVEQSVKADMLVVGSRGHGGFAGLLLGSVAQQCAHHAACPVTVVRA